MAAPCTHKLRWRVSQMICRTFFVAQPAQLRRGGKMENGVALDSASQDTAFTATPAARYTYGQQSPIAPSFRQFLPAAPHQLYCCYSCPSCWACGCVLRATAPLLLLGYGTTRTERNGGTERACCERSFAPAATQTPVRPEDTEPAGLRLRTCLLAPTRALLSSSGGRI